MGLLNLLVLKKVNEVQTAKAKDQLHSPPIPSFIIPVVAAQILLAALMVHTFDIPTRHMLFCILYPTYLVMANHFRFGNNIIIRQRSNHHPFNLSVVMSKIFSGSDTSWFICYMASATTVGVLLPLLTVVLAPTDVADAAISPLLVLWTQLTCETATMLNPYVHRFIAFLVPLGFFVYRESLLVDWFSTSLASYESASASDTSSQWYTFGLILSSVNLIFWTANLSVFTLLRWAPELLADDKCESLEIEWKMMVPHQVKPNGLKKKSSSVGGDEQGKNTVPAKAA
uniref:DUF7733 domain-containing protein n=1 Tax=Skeletonema marinoi TaxID=267567 RepID=A0A7S2PDP0_9STRA|mmetsp:Transcript_19841/g.33556  ORF Transcript_19841/g.33556 Transcript_19841/m.33556 type:complete len:285 (+) Transcript_19841:90-944(+)